MEQRSVKVGHISLTVRIERPRPSDNEEFWRVWYDGEVLGSIKVTEQQGHLSTYRTYEGEGTDASRYIHGGKPPSFGWEEAIRAIVAHSMGMVMKK